MNAQERHNKRLDEMEREHKEMEASARRYLARIGAKGGRKSKRKLSKREARRMAKLRWDRK